VGVKQRAYPSHVQAENFWDFTDHERFLVNLAVEQYEFAFQYRAYAANPSKASKSRHRWPSDAERQRQLTELRSTQRMEWLRGGCQNAQQQALRVIDRAYRNWFANPTHFRRPKFRSKGDNQGFSLAGRQNVDLRRVSRRWAEIKVPKTGWVRFRITVAWECIVGARSVRFTIDKSGRWFVSFPGPQPEIERIRTGAVVGVDRGVASSIATSDGAFGHAPGLTSKEAERLVRMERQLARQQTGSKRRERTKASKSRVTARLVDRRRDWIEKTTTWLVETYDIVCIEKLNVRAMTASAKGTLDNPGRNVRQKAGLNKAILAQCWGRWFTRLRQKGAAAGVLVIEVAAEGTSITCPKCGNVDRNNRESQADFCCTACGHQRHADTNAAVNILQRGLGQLREQDPQAVPRQGDAVSARGDSGLPGSEKREAQRAA
jgi:transposase